MNVNRDILVYGYLGYLNNQLDGQTIKTRSILRLLKENSTDNNLCVKYFDTQNYKKSKFSFLKSLFDVLQADILFYLPAHNNLKYLFPIIFLVSQIFRVEIHYVVVGGWLHEFLKKLPLHRWMLRKVKCIYPQTNELVKLLEKNYNFHNVKQLNNFRFIDEVYPKIGQNEKNNVRLVFMARVHPRKGLNTIFELGDRLRMLGRNDVTIDVYGPIYEQYKNEFYDRLNEYKGIIKYCGVLLPENVVSTLVKYDIFLFPTEYYTEGFPGSILEAYLANLPVVATNWQYASEFIIDGKTGYICEFNNTRDYIDKVVGILENPSILNQLSEFVKIHKHKYSPTVAWNILKQNIL